MMINKGVLAVLAAATVISGCATSATVTAAGRVPEALGGDVIFPGGTDPMPPATAAEARKELSVASSAISPTGMRQKAISEIAAQAGSQAGYERRRREILNELQLKSGQMSNVFDFNRVAVRAPIGAGVIVPPVIGVGKGAFAMNGEGTEAATADAYMSIIRAGRIAPAAPSWIDYLIVDGAKPAPIPSVLDPKDATERKIFDQAFDAAFPEGAELANIEFEERMNRLKRDYQGMLTYHKLVSQGMMDRMVLADADFGVTTTPTEMRIGSRVVKIETGATFNGDTGRWRADQGAVLTVPQTLTVGS